MNSKKLLKIASIVSGISGIVILFSVVYPIVSYDLGKKDRFSDFLDSTSKKVLNENTGETDYTKASNWFPTTDSNFVSENITYYTLSIPKLKIENATVAIGGEDLSQNLIQYPGTAMPGKRGNAAIFGHSILPQFYDPKDYLAIFSKLPDLDKGDEISVSYDGIIYKYRVEDKFEVLPTDIQVLEQNLSDSFLTLVTCVPPGDPRRPKRLIVRARVVPLGAMKQTNDNFGN